MLRTYTNRSNARRAAKAAGLPPDSVKQIDDEFGFEIPDDTVDEQPVNGQDHQNGARPQPEEPDPLDIPAILQLTPEERRQGWIDNPPEAPARELRKEASMAKKATAKKRDRTGNPGDKTSLLLSMLKAKGGTTVEQMTKSLGWLPHTLRARISTLAKEKRLKIERTRNEGVTTYRIAA